MNTVNYVSFDTAKLLKQAGFSGKTHMSFRADGTAMHSCAGKDDFAAPHLWTAMKWLREKHNIHVDTSAKFWGEHTGWTAMLFDTQGKVAISNQSLGQMRKNENGADDFYPTVYPSHEAAVDAAVAAACQYIMSDYCRCCAFFSGQTEGAYLCMAEAPEPMMTHPGNRCINKRFKQRPA